MIKTDEYLLAIESAISGGSIALFRADEMIGSKDGSESVSRAEDLLPSITSLLEDAKVSRLELSRIAVSLGPGSYTGLRIGISTVMGLGKGLNIPYIGVPLFEALPYEDGSIVAVPMGKADICFAPTNDPSSIQVGSIEEITSVSGRFGSKRVLCHSDLIVRLEGMSEVDLVDLGTNLAEYVGFAAFDRPSSHELKPIYVQNPRFG